MAYPLLPIFRLNIKTKKEAEELYFSIEERMKVMNEKYGIVSTSYLMRLKAQLLRLKKKNFPNKLKIYSREEAVSLRSAVVMYKNESLVIQKLKDQLLQLMKNRWPEVDWIDQ